MKMKSFIATTMAMFLVLSLFSIPAFAAESTTENTKASIAFETGELEIDDGEYDDDMHNMNINFGSNPLPVSASNYPAKDGDHMLRVNDARGIAGNWSVTVKMTPFKNKLDSENVFDAAIKLEDGTGYSNHNDSSIINITNPVMIDSESEYDAPVVSVTQTATHGVFDTVWTKADTILLIGDEATGELKSEAEYEATLIWTLSAT